MSIHDIWPLPIWHVCESLIAVDKPAGLPSVPGRTEALKTCAASLVQARWADALVVHRLDMATSGLLLFARGARAQRELSRAFAERLVDKRYVAVVQGTVADEQGCIELPLAADWPNRPRQRVDSETGKPSTTLWRVLEHLKAADGSARTRLELHPLTGRSHQLRVHLAAIGHPIAGDALYGPPNDPTPRLLLHACQLGLAHPTTAEPLRFDSPVPF